MKKTAKSILGHNEILEEKILESNNFSPMKNSQLAVELKYEADHHHYIDVQEIEYIEFYVGNAYQAMNFFVNVLGFKAVAYAGLETGVKDRVSYVIECEGVRLILTSSLIYDSPISEHVKRHGDSIIDIAFIVDNINNSLTKAVQSQARPIQEPTVLCYGQDQAIKATIAGYGHLVHSLVQRHPSKKTFLPNYQPIQCPVLPSQNHIVAIDHLAFCVEQGNLESWNYFYHQVFGFHESHQEAIATQYSAMNSKVLRNDNGKIKFTITEPAAGNCQSQITEFLTFNYGYGVQHLAFLSNNICQTVRFLCSNGIEFLQIPATYYNQLEKRLGHAIPEIKTFQELNILVDKDQTGYLMQAFTKPIQSRPTFFLEIIERKGAEGFGSGNIKALFEAVESEQRRRGNLKT
ncbi:MAG: 4-hydroxyphenylpyruvate dioxygenase [Nostoc sp.]